MVAHDLLAKCARVLRPDIVEVENHAFGTGAPLGILRQLAKNPRDTFGKIQIRQPLAAVERLVLEWFSTHHTGENGFPGAGLCSGGANASVNLQ